MKGNRKNLNSQTAFLCIIEKLPISSVEAPLMLLTYGVSRKTTVSTKKFLDASSSTGRFLGRELKYG